MSTVTVDISRALTIPGWMEPNELTWLAEQASSHERIAELGSFLGRSTVVLAQNTLGTVTAIDRWQRPLEYMTQYDDTLPEFIKNTSGLLNIGVLRADHSELPKFFHLESFDMIFIDGDHSYEGCKRDIEFWKTKLSHGGLLCGHDYTWGWPGVEQAVRECCPGYKVAHGTTIWYWDETMRGETSPEKTMPSGLVKRNLGEMKAIAGKALLDASVSAPLIESKPVNTDWSHLGGGVPKAVGVGICLPMSGRYNPPEFSIALAMMAPPPNTQVMIFATKGQRRDEARCDLVKQSRACGAEYTLFIDDDNPPPPETIYKLKFTLDNADDDVMVVAGIYCSKSNPPYPMVFQGDGRGPFWKWKVGEVFECERIATGCMLIRNSVFDLISEPWFKDVHEFNPELQRTIEITDDIWFCRKVREAGFKILAHGGVLPSHWDENGNCYSLPPDSYPMRP